LKVTTNILTAVLILISLITLALLGAGSHGHMGLWDHGDSFFFYVLIFYCFVLIAGLHFMNYNRNGGSQIKRNTLIGYMGILFFVGAMMSSSTYHEDLTSTAERVGIADYIKLLLPMSIMMYWAYKILMTKKAP
jgi:hypothetical protein